MIDNTSEYISLQAKRAEGALPEMGSSKRVFELVVLMFFSLLSTTDASIF